MADPARRLAANAPGPFFVDASCIDCDACRQLAPATFTETAEFSAVTAQPREAHELADALRALVACPVGAIGDAEHRPVADAVAAFPLRIDGPVSYLGFNARASYGANAYLLEHDGGNWMIDSPRWTPSLVRALEERGGVRYVFLTHRDDVADARRYAAHFGAQRIIHARDRSAQPDAEIVVDGDDAVAFGDVTVIPTPGHTRGHCVLHHRTYLFSGDHLAWDRETRRLSAHPDVCWYDWRTQLRSVAKLAEYDVEWLLPGHGARVHLDANAMRRAMLDVAARG
ncbi:MAG TPA: MBL fold metallo-hydrolase [Candidatus Elarobacter sp.]|jgi:glyoxylase-like metal-dependent hydrolase (beta-lactamase superfamily II)/ferredoxin|nr:MBL fold metallo-hydrolase [Candidatus Elarobacter sp.]